MAAPASETLELLARWHAGERAALDRLLELHVPWIHAYVRRRMGAELRRFDQSADVVQDVVQSFLERGPAFVPQDEAQFRALLGRVALNRLRDLADHARAARRDPRREVRLDSRSVSRIGAHAPSSQRPDRRALEAESRNYVELALCLLDPRDRDLIQRREWDGQEFARIGADLDLSADAVRMRFNAAVARLGNLVRKLQTGRLGDLQVELDDAERS